MLFRGIFSEKTRGTDVYNDGVKSLHRGDYYSAVECFKEAARHDHPSAHYNLSLIYGQGLVSPFDIDFAKTSLINAARLGHDKAAENVKWIEAADRGGFGADNLTSSILHSTPSPTLEPLIFTSLCLFYKAISDMYGVRNGIILYQLGSLAKEKSPDVDRFLARTGLPDFMDDYESFITQVEDGSPEAQIIDGIMNYFAAMRVAGNSREVCILARCTLAGYMIQRSDFGANSKPLLGADKFFANSP